MTEVCLELCHAAGPTVLEGPFTQNKIYCAMLSAATDRELLGTDGSSTGTSIGAALLTSAGTSTSVYYKSLADKNLAGNGSNSRLRSYREKWRDKLETI